MGRLSVVGATLPHIRDLSTNGWAVRERRSEVDRESLAAMLTNLEELHKLCAGGAPMRSQGTIRAKGACPKCGKKFTEVKGVGYVCPDHETVPKKLYVDLSSQGQRVRVFSDGTGRPLDSYPRAKEVLGSINNEIKEHRFDPQKYIQAEASKFWTSTLTDQFLKHRVKGLAPAYQGHFTSTVNTAGEYFKNKDVREIRKIDLINYRDHLEQKFTWKAKTLKNAMDIFKTFMGYVKNDLEIIDRVPPFPKIEVPNAPFAWIDQKDQVRLFEMVPDEHKPIIAFLILHGCRPGEAMALRCKDVDPKHGCITISATFSGKTYCTRRKGRGARVAAIPVHPEMREYLEERTRETLPEAYVFVNPVTCRHYTHTKLEEIWRHVREQAGTSDKLRLYDATRHSFASQLVNSGVSLFKVSKLLGHSSTRAIRTNNSRIMLLYLDIS
jgi:integrase